MSCKTEYQTFEQALTIGQCNALPNLTICKILREIILEHSADPVTFLIYP